MTWLKRLRYFFFGSPKPIPSLLELETNPITSVNEPLLESIKEVEKEEAFPDWVSSEDTLRDEGVIYGLSDVDPVEKIKLIESVFNKESAGFIKNKEELSEKIGELNLLLEKKNLQIEDLKTKSGEAKEKQKSDENILRVAIGLLLSIGMCTANYFIIKAGIAYGFPNESEWIAWGVFLSGMFSMYYTTSLIHSNDSLTWRRALEELGMPLAASIFVYVQVVPHMPWYKSLAFLLFTFFIFLISGKLLLSSIAKLKSELNIYKRNGIISKDKALAGSDWSNHIERLESDMEGIRLEKWKIVSSLNHNEIQITRLSAERDTATNLFLSEYSLAKKYKDRLSKTQISTILNK